MIITYKLLLIILHVFGVVIGMGGAITSDFIFFSSIKDKVITHTELRFLRLGHKLVWAGLAIMVLTGILLFAQNISGYLHSTKFLAKMTIVGIIIINGYIFHRKHIPHLHRHEGRSLTRSNKFKTESASLFVSGAISLTSWTAAFVLGFIKSIPYSYVSIMLVYFVILALSILISYWIRKKLLLSKT